MHRLQAISRVGAAPQGWAVGAPCASWPARAANRYTGPWNATTPSPILLVGTRFDPNTPLVNARLAERRLGNAVLLTHDGYGHLSNADPSSCVSRRPAATWSTSAPHHPGPSAPPTASPSTPTSASRPPLGRWAERPPASKGGVMEATRKLYRSRTNRKVAGVCGGLAQYFNTDATVIRVLFVILAVLGGGGLLIYLAMWIIVPSEP